MPTTAKMNTTMLRTSERFASAPIVLKMIVSNMFSVGHDFASLKMRSYSRKEQQKVQILWKQFISIDTRN